MLHVSILRITVAGLASLAVACSDSNTGSMPSVGGGGTGGTSAMPDGAATGGAPGSGSGGALPADAGATTMSFFATSVGHPNGGNLGGLEGADAFCTQLASAMSAALGAKTWHAYLSTSTVNARDRIGSGPWINAAGHVIAPSVATLHDQAQGGMLDATWPIGDTSVALDERGTPVPTSPQRHDILTGTGMDGTVMAGMTCSDWTSAATTDMVEVGHANRTGGGRPPSFSSAHSAGCAPGPDATANNVAGTVTQGGGRGSIYCFAVP